MQDYNILAPSDQDKEDGRDRPYNTLPCIFALVVLKYRKLAGPAFQSPCHYRGLP
jgi:hypothetical protein